MVERVREGAVVWRVWSLGANAAHALPLTCRPSDDLETWRASDDAPCSRRRMLTFMGDAPLPVLPRRRLAPPPPPLRGVSDDARRVMSVGRPSAPSRAGGVPATGGSDLAEPPGASEVEEAVDLSDLRLPLGKLTRGDSGLCISSESSSCISVADATLLAARPPARPPAPPSGGTAGGGLRPPSTWTDTGTACAGLGSTPMVLRPARKDGEEAAEAAELSDSCDDSHIIGSVAIAMPTSVR